MGLIVMSSHPVIFTKSDLEAIFEEELVKSAEVLCLSSSFYNCRSKWEDINDENSIPTKQSICASLSDITQKERYNIEVYIDRNPNDYKGCSGLSMRGSCSCENKNCIHHIAVMLYALKIFGSYSHETCFDDRDIYLFIEKQRQLERISNTSLSLDDRLTAWSDRTTVDSPFVNKLSKSQIESKFLTKYKISEKRKFIMTPKK